MARSSTENTCFQCLSRRHTSAIRSSDLVPVEPSNPSNDGTWQENEFSNQQGLKIRAYHACPPESSMVRGIAVLVHGIKCNALFEFLNADDSGRHCVFKGSLADSLVSSGFHVFTYDQQSHGLSEGLHGYTSYVDSVDDLAFDLLQLAELSQKLVAKTADNKILPVFAVGESMGGGVACRAAQLEPSTFKGLVLLAPMLSVEKLAKMPMNRALKKVGVVLSHVVPAARLMYLPPPEKFPHIHEQFQADPLNDKSQFVRVRTAMTMSSFCEYVMQHLAEIQTPFITFHSKDDTLVDPDSSAALLRDASTNDKEYMQVDHMWHALLHEPGSDQVIEKIATWMNQRA